MIEVLWLHFFLICLPVVKIIEVRDNHRYGKGYGKHTSNCAKWAHDFPPYSHWPVKDFTNQQKRTLIVKDYHQDISNIIHNYKVKLNLNGKQLKNCETEKIWGIVYFQIKESCNKYCLSYVSHLIFGLLSKRKKHFIIVVFFFPFSTIICNLLARKMQTNNNAHKKPETCRATKTIYSVTKEIVIQIFKFYMKLTLFRKRN